MLIETADNGVYGFTLDSAIPKFRVSHPDIRTPAHGKPLGCNEGNSAQWDGFTRRYLQFVKSGPDGGDPYRGP